MDEIDFKASNRATGGQSLPPKKVKYNASYSSFYNGIPDESAIKKELAKNIIDILPMEAFDKLFHYEKKEGVDDLTEHRWPEYILSIKI